MITCVIYDMDGLLLDTEGVYTTVTQSIVERYGKRFDWSLKSQMIGRSAMESAQFLISALDLPLSPEDYLAERQVKLLQGFSQVAAMPGALQLTAHLRAAGIPQAVATSSSQILFDSKTASHQNWFKIFDFVINGDDPELGLAKPAPDIFLLAAKRLSVTPEACLVFEDAPAGIQAALAAHMTVIGVPDPNLDPQLMQGAHQILQSLENFIPETWGLPPYLTIR